MSFKVEIIQHTDQAGNPVFIEKYEDTVDVSVLDYAPKYRLGCEVCKKHGKNLACPPHAPLLPDYIHHATKVKILMFRVPMEHFAKINPAERYHVAFNLVRDFLVRELLQYRKAGHIVAGAGPCTICGHCAAEQGGTVCVNPDERIFSLEAMCVNIVPLSQKVFGVELEWSGIDTVADYVSAIGAVFIKN